MRKKSRERDMFSMRIASNGFDRDVYSVQRQIAPLTSLDPRFGAHTVVSGQIKSQTNVNFFPNRQFDLIY